mgnify:CR=1 FL=1
MQPPNWLTQVCLLRSVVFLQTDFAREERRDASQEHADLDHWKLSSVNIESQSKCVTEVQRSSCQEGEYTVVSLRQATKIRVSWVIISLRPVVSELTVFFCGPAVSPM